MTTLAGCVPTSTRGLWVTGVAAAAGWAGLYALNEWVWDALRGALPASARDTHAVAAVHFFLYDVTKIALLLTGIIFVVTVLRSFLTIERTRKLLGGRREGIGNLMAGALGVAAPFCSCSAVPAFIGFVSAGVPIGVTLSFLIASPLVNEIAIGLLWGTFGWRVALLYVAAGYTIAVVAGFVLGRLRAERWVADFVKHPSLVASSGGAPLALAEPRLTPRRRAQAGIAEVKAILGKVWPYLLVGVGLGAAIHGWAPTDFFAAHAGADNPFGVLVAVVLGVPLYSNAAGALPLLEALADKGVPMGTLLAFMMSVVALSLPEMVLLKRVLKLPLIASFIAIVAAGIVAVGYLFNAILG